MVFDKGFGLGFVDLLLDGEGGYHLGVDAGLEDAVFVIDVGGATGHSCAEVLAGGAEDDDEAVGHVFTTVVAAAFYYGVGAGESYAEAFSCAAIDEESASGGSVEAGVAYDGVFGWVELVVGVWLDGDSTAGHAFAYEVVSLAGDV